MIACVYPGAVVFCIRVFIFLGGNDTIQLFLFRQTASTSVFIYKFP